MGPHWPADTFLQSQVQIARGVTVGVHTFSQLMFDIVDVEREWAKVCPVDAHTILHRSTEVVRALDAFQLTDWSPCRVFSRCLLEVFGLPPRPSQSPPVLVWAVSTPMFTPDKIEIEDSALAAMLALQLP